MRCGSCGWDNPAGIIFCTNCGKRMADRAGAGASAIHAHGAAAGMPGEQGAAVAVPHRATQLYAEGRPAPASVACPRCGADSEPDMRFCRECGTSLDGAPNRAPAQLAFASCLRCGSARESDALFCRHCGAEFKDATSALSGVTPSVGAVSPAGSAAVGSSGGLPIGGLRNSATPRTRTGQPPSISRGWAERKRIYATRV
jgi:hypothetical protein